MQVSTEAVLVLTRAELVPWLERGARVLVILGLAWAMSRVARRLLAKLRGYAIKMMDRRGATASPDMEKRAATIVSVLGKLVSAAIWMVAAVMALTELTFNIQPLLAGLGVAGLALGLGAQSLIKDWLGGLFMLLEDQVRIGDGVNINGIAGAVEEINLRTTVLRLENGAVHIIPNGAITQLTNFTREYAYYVFEATLGHEANVDQAIEILREAGAEVATEAQFQQTILAPIEVMGVDRLTDKGPLLRARIKAVPGKQAMVGRELNRRFKEKAAAAGMPFPAGL